MSIIIYYIMHLEVFTFLLFVFSFSQECIIESKWFKHIKISLSNTAERFFLNKTAQSLSNFQLN